MFSTESMGWWIAHLVIGLPAGLLVANFGEWLVHKHLLHNRGRKKGTFWAFHFYDHHNESRQNNMHDSDYEEGWITGGWNARTKEAVLLTATAAGHLLLLPVAPGFALAVVYSIVNYYFKHKKAHLDTEWARRKLPWHVDHHMGPDQEKNWCVTWPWADIILGTRVPYVGTEREAADIARRDALRAKRSSARPQPSQSL